MIQHLKVLLRYKRIEYFYRLTNWMLFSKLAKTGLSNYNSKAGL